MGYWLPAAARKVRNAHMQALKGRPWRTVPPRRAIGEAVAAGVLLALLAYLSLIRTGQGELPRLTPTLLLLTGPGCALWCAACSRMLAHSWERELPKTFLTGL